jgi:hypothetical protein
MKFPAMACVSLGMIGFLTPASAAIVIESEPIGGGSYFYYTFTITEDIEFTVDRDATGSLRYFVLKGFGEGRFSGGMSTITENFNFTLNGEDYSESPNFFANWGSFGAIGEDDAYLDFSSYNLVEGDTLIVRAGALRVSALVGSMEGWEGTYTGEVVLADASGALSNKVLLQVPEPHTAFLAGLGGLALMRRRRRN